MIRIDIANHPSEIPLGERLRHVQFDHRNVFDVRYIPHDAAELDVVLLDGHNKILRRFELKRTASDVVSTLDDERGSTDDPRSEISRIIADDRNKLIILMSRERLWKEMWEEARRKTEYSNHPEKAAARIVLRTKQTLTMLDDMGRLSYFQQEDMFISHIILLDEVFRKYRKMPAPNHGVTTVLRAAGLPWDVARRCAGEFASIDALVEAVRTDPDRLLEIDGIAKVRLARIIRYLRGAD